VQVTAVFFASQSRAYATMLCHCSTLSLTSIT
jgi:hypothetical protein